MKGVHAKKPQGNTIICRVSKAFDFIYRGKMEQILLAYCLPKETIAAIMILYKNTKVKIHLPDEDTDFFDIVTGVLQRDTFAPYLSRLHALNICKFNERKWLYAGKGKKQKIPRMNDYKYRLR